MAKREQKHLMFKGIKEHQLEGPLELQGNDVLILGSRPYITHAGLLHLAHEKGCAAIEVRILRELCSPQARRWVVEAVVYRTEWSRGFTGFGDADPANVSPEMRGAELRIAETRAVNRALRKAYGVGLCSYEELGAKSRAPQPAPKPESPSLRERLALLVRNYGLDAQAVKRYAADFCRVENLKQAHRSDVERFVEQLANGLAHEPEQIAKVLSNFATEAA